MIQLNFMEPIFLALKSTGPLQNLIPSNCLLATLLWCIWGWRCKALFQDGFQLMPNPINYIKQYWLQWNQVQLIHKQSPTQRLIMVRWENPPNGFIKLNVDSSCKDHNSIAAGGVVRDTTGTWISGFSSKLGVGSPLLAEIWALYLGFQLLDSMGHTAAIIETDASDLIHLINEGDLTHYPYANLVLECRQTLRLHDDWSLKHVFREANGVAHALALLGQFNTSGLQIYHVMPASLTNAMSFDCNRSFHARYVNE